MKSKIKSKNGFTMVEMLATTLIIVMIAMSVVSGAKAMTNVFWQSTFVSDSSSAASTINLALSDILRYSTYDAADSETYGKVLLSNAEYGIEKKCITVDSGQLYIYDAVANAPISAVVNSGVYGDLIVRDFSIIYSDGVFSGSYVIFDQYETGDKLVTFAFRTLRA